MRLMLELKCVPVQLKLVGSPARGGGLRFGGKMDAKEGFPKEGHLS